MVNKKENNKNIEAKKIKKHKNIGRFAATSLNFPPN